MHQQTAETWFVHRHLTGLGRAATNTFLFFLAECAVSSCQTERGGVGGEGERALKQINVIAFSNCGGGGGFVRVVWFYDVHLSVGGWKLSRQMTPH